MRRVVRDNYRAFTVSREGFTPFMYCDNLNLVTSGIGNLIDAGARNGFDISEAAMAPAMRLPWRFRAAGWTSKNPVAGGLAPKGDVRAAWIATKLKEREEPGFNKRGGFAYAGLTHVTLDNAALDILFESTLDNFDKQLSKAYPGYEAWPADAQLCVLSMAWAMGPGFPTTFTRFSAAMNQEDFEGAIPHAVFKGGGATLADGGLPATSRNAAGEIMLQNAATVVKAGVDRDRLFFPGGVDSPGLLAAGTTKRIGTYALITLEALAVTAGLGAVGYSVYETQIKPKRGRRRA